MPLLEDRVAVRRLFDRFGLGARRSDVDDGASRGFDASLQVLLAPNAEDNGAIATPPPPLEPIPSAPVGDPRRAAADEQRSSQQADLKLWWLDRMAAVEAPTLERLTWFWHDHFATSEEKVVQPDLMLTQNETLRRLGVGDFRTLLHAMVADPAMIIWLDGQTNRKQQPNENLGRELLELFTLGVGQYTEADVREAARALTGWTVEPEAGTSSFQPRKHDAGGKTILGKSAAYDAGGLVDMVVATPASARFVATRLWARLVSPTPPGEEDLERLTDAYGAQTDLTALLHALATSTAFRDPAASMVKQPVQWATGLARAVSARPGKLDERRQKSLITGLQRLGQVPFQPPNVGGWPAGSVWLTPSATVHRLAVAATLLTQASLPSPPRGGNARLEWARATLAVDRWSDRTRQALAGLTTGDPRRLLAAAAVSPEYVVSG